MRLRSALLAVLVASTAFGEAAEASWDQGGDGSGFSKAKTMPAGNQPTASVSNRDVTVSWTASSFSAGPNVSGYDVKRYDTGGNEQSIGSACSGTVSALSCTESAVPAGTWKYSVTPKHGSNWRGAESPQSATVTVQSPNLSFTSLATVTSLPTTLNGDISNFISGQTVTFRLDNPNTGTVLSGSIAPDPVAANGNASVSVTIPNGTANGSHTVYAIGNQGDVAGAAITVSVSTAQSFTTPAWTVSDQADTTAADTSDPYAAAGGPFDFQLGFQPAFATNRYLEFDYNGPLRAGLSTSGVSFNFDYIGTNADGTVAANTCFYFEVRRISTGNVLDTHGSAGSPVDCHNALAFKSTSTALPEVTSTEIANDLRIRVFMTNSLTQYNTEDRGTVTGSQGSNAFTLYRTTRVNQASGTPTTTPWSLNASGDGAVFTSTDWATTFSASRYLRLTYPAYVPSTATGISATFKHAYKSNTSATTSCWYFEVYNGATLIGTHGSAGTPVSCNATTSFATDTVSLPEVDTVAEANNVVVRVYATNSSGTSSTRETQSDLATVKVDYTDSPPTPNLSFTSPTTFTSLPTTLNGDISNFATGQTVSFRLDDPNTGTVLSGSIAPDPVPANGNASVSVTIPNGTANGSHTVYAIGSGGDVADATITITTTFTTPAWTVSDQADTSAADTSEAYAAVGGGLDLQLGFQPAFDTNRYLELDYNGPLRAGLATSGVNFNFDYVGTNAGVTAGANTCFYFEVRRISTGSVLATHGSAGSPVDCANQFTFKQTSTALPEVTSTDIANDLRIRVFMNNADGAGYIFEDRGTVTGSEGSNAFTLYRTTGVNQATGTPTTSPWALNASGDSSVYTSGNGSSAPAGEWATTFSATRYLKFTYPAYVPSTASDISATFKHAYKSNTSSTNSCWYFEVYNNTTLIGTHGSSGSPVSCNATTSFTTDTVSLPEVNTVAEANNVVVRVHATNNSGTAANRKTQHDLATVKVDYTD